MDNTTFIGTDYGTVTAFTNDTGSKVGIRVLTYDGYGARTRLTPANARRLATALLGMAEEMEARA